MKNTVTITAEWDSGDGHSKCTHELRNLGGLPFPFYIALAAKNAMRGAEIIETVKVGAHMVLESVEDEDEPTDAAENEKLTAMVTACREYLEYVERPPSKILV